MVHDSRNFIALLELQDTANRYQIQPDPTEAGMYRLIGHPVTVTNRVPANGGVGNESSIVLADMSQIAVARDLADLLVGRLSSAEVQL